jgi:hypothetical protein
MALARLARYEASGERERVMRSQANQDLMLAASNYVMSASCWLMMDPAKALVMFRQAATSYRQIGHDYWMVLTLISGSQQDIDEMLSHETEEGPEPSPLATAFSLPANELSDPKGRAYRWERLNSSWRHFGTIPVGRLSIPLDHCGLVANAMKNAREETKVAKFMASAANFVNRAAEVIRAASNDRFHWLQFQSAVLPTEPEAIAITRLLSITSHVLFGMPITEIPDLDSHGRLLVQMGEEMRKVD